MPLPDASVSPLASWPMASFQLHGRRSDCGPRSRSGSYKPQEIGGRMKTGLALVQGMFVVALDVDGATFARFDQHGVGDFAFLEGAGVVVRDAWDDFFLLLGVGNDGRAAFGWSTAGAGCQGGRRAEQS